MTRLNRRSFLKALPLATAAGGLLAVGATGKFTTDQFEVTQTTVPVKNLSPEFQGYRIAFLSDLHCGVTFPLAWVHKALQLAKDSGASLLLLGGDYLWIPTSRLARNFPLIREERFAGLPEGKMIRAIYDQVAKALTDYHFEDGICAVHGNHDRWENPRHCEEQFNKVGVHYLVNSTHSVQRGRSSLVVYGADDYWTGFPKFPEAGEIPKDAVSILLAHNPDFHKRAFYAPHARFDFAIAGHTHGGQIVPLPGCPLVTNIQNKELRAGLYIGGRFPIYTSRGVGVVEIPYRFNCNPEVTVIELQKDGTKVT
jgi:predicted MPP superfamily phosphohydrolase